MCCWSGRQEVGVIGATMRRRDLRRAWGGVREGSAVVVHYLMTRDMKYYVESYVRNSIELIVEHGSHGHERRSVWQLMPIRRHGWRFSTASS